MIIAALMPALATPAQDPKPEDVPKIEVEITVSATRTGGRIDEQPLRVKVLEREEIEEKMLMTPGDIVMMLNEMGGMRVQATSPSLGAASVRVQGMRGRYTRFLSDGLPLFGEVAGLGLLQIVRQRERAVCHPRRARGAPLRPPAPVHQWRKPDGREANGVAAAHPPRPRRRWPMDRRRMGAARGP